MFTLLEWLTVISVSLTMLLGVGALLYVIVFIWSRTIDLIFPLFNFHKEFLAWHYEKYKPKVFTPTLKERDELKSRLTRDKEADE